MSPTIVVSSTNSYFLFVQNYVKNLVRWDDNVRCLIPDWLSGIITILTDYIALSSLRSALFVANKLMKYQGIITPFCQDKLKINYKITINYITIKRNILDSNENLIKK